MLGEKLAKHGAQTWLVNTGWSGGPHGVGKRMSIKHTRALIAAALSGALQEAPCREDPVFGVMVPQECPGVPSEVLWPRNTWADPAAYDQQARHLAQLFAANFVKFADSAMPETIAAGPRLDV